MLRNCFLLLLFPLVFNGQSASDPDSLYRGFYKVVQSENPEAAETEFIFLKKHIDGPLADFYVLLAQSDVQRLKDEKQKLFITCFDAISLAATLGSDSLLFKANFKTGQAYMYNDDLASALVYYDKCLLSLKSTTVVSDRILLYKDIALIYSYLDKNELAIEFFLKMEPLIRQTGNRKYLGNTYNNLGINYMRLKEYAKALQYFRNSMAIRHEMKDLQGVAQVQNNLGSLYYEWGQYQVALDYFTTSAELRKSSGVPIQGIIESDINLGKTYARLGQNEKALSFLEKARKLSIKHDFIELERRADEQLINIYREKKNYQQAFELQERYYMLKDSLYGLDKKEEIGRLSFVSRLKQDSLLHIEAQRKEAFVFAEKEKRADLIRNIFIAGFVLVLLVAGLLYQQVKRIRKANKIIALQKDELEIKQKEILDSIHYAERIQKSLLPSETYIKRILAQKEK